MRPLHGDETKAFFEKLANYIGSENIPRLLNRSEGTYLFLLHKERVFYVSEKIAKYAGSCARENLISFGVCFGKFTKTKKFRLQITALDYLAPYAQFKIWVKPSSEQSFLYGNHVLKKLVSTPQMISRGSSKIFIKNFLETSPQVVQNWLQGGPQGNKISFLLCL